MPGKTPSSNGVRNNEAKDAQNKSKKTAKDGDEEMTVVVPPSKKAPAGDADGDVEMGGEDDAEVKVDPVVQAVAGS